MADTANMPQQATKSTGNWKSIGELAAEAARKAGAK